MCISTLVVVGLISDQYFLLGKRLVLQRDDSDFKRCEMFLIFLYIEHAHKVFQVGKVCCEQLLCMISDVYCWDLFT